MTPFLLERFHTHTHGESLRANVRLVLRNAALAARDRERAVIYVLGDINVDVVAAHDGPIAQGSDTAAAISMRPGGSGGNVAAWLAHAGAEVTLIGRVGTDAAADDRAPAARRRRAVRHARRDPADRHLHRARRARRGAHDAARPRRQRRAHARRNCPS